MIDLAFHESFLREIFTSCWFAKFSPLPQEYFIKIIVAEKNPTYKTRLLHSYVYLLYLVYNCFCPSGLEWKWLWTSSEEAEDHPPGPPTPVQAKEAKKKRSSHQTQPPTGDVETSREEELSDEPLYSRHKQGKANQQRAS